MNPNPPSAVPPATAPAAPSPGRRGGEAAPAVRVSVRVTFAVSLVLNTLVAAVLWLAVPAMGAFGPILAYSQAIGLAITAIAVIVGHLPWVQRLPRLAAVLVMLVPAAPLGYLIGHALAGWLLGRPLLHPMSGPTATGAWLATLLATALAGLVLWGRARIRSEEAARAQAQRLAAEAELRLLRAQLEPHMLFNTLANLRELIADDPAAAQRMLDSLIVFLRGTLAATRSERATLAEEFARLEAYLGLMGVRMGTRLAWRLDLPEALREATLPPMLLQPLVENAIRHGLEPQVGPGSIEVAAARAGDAVVITVADTGRGLVEAAAADSAADAARAAGGYGVYHVRERLRAAFGAAASLELQPQAPHGVRAVVRIPA